MNLLHCRLWNIIVVLKTCQYVRLKTYHGLGQIIFSEGFLKRLISQHRAHVLGGCVKHVPGM